MITKTKLLMVLMISLVSCGRSFGKDIIGLLDNAHTIPAIKNPGEIFIDLRVVSEGCYK
jgi:hypothetical protein